MDDCLNPRSHTGPPEHWQYLCNAAIDVDVARAGSTGVMQPSVQQLLLLPGFAIPAARQQSHELHSPQAAGLHPSESHPLHGGCTMGIRGSAPAYVRINPFGLAELNLFYSTQNVYLSFIHESSSQKDRSDFTTGKCSRHLPASRSDQTPTAAQCSYHAPTPRETTEPPFKLRGLRQGIPARKALIFPRCRERGHPCSAVSLPAGLLIWLPCAHLPEGDRLRMAPWR